MADDGDTDKEKKDYSNTEDDSLEEQQGDTIEEKRGDTVEKRQGSTGEGNHCNTVEETHGNTVTTYQGEAVEVKQANAIEETNSDTVEEIYFDIVEENQGDTSEEVDTVGKTAGDTVEENKGDTAGQKQGDIVAETKCDTVEEMEGKTVKEKNSDTAEGNRENESLYKQRKKLQDLLLVKHVEDGIPNAHMLLLGKPGAGKSSFINTIVKALLGKYFIVADAGMGDCQTKTLHLSTFDQFGVLNYMLQMGKVEYDKDFVKCLPRITDFSGLADEDNMLYEEILYLLIQGYIPPGTTIEAIIRQQKKGKLTTMFATRNEDWRVSHILFFQSCREAASANLAKCLGKVISRTGENDKLAFSGLLHVLMTKADQVEENETAENEKVLERILVLRGKKEYAITRWTNSCDETGYKCLQRDTLALKFLRRLLLHPWAHTQEAASEASGKI